MSIAMRLDALDVAAQGRKRACTCGAHAPLPREDCGPPRFRENPKLAHLFMICSNIKLTGPAESIGFKAQAIHQWNQRDSTRENPGNDEKRVVSCTSSLSTAKPTSTAGGKR